MSIISKMKRLGVEGSVVAAAKATGKFAFKDAPGGQRLDNFYSGKKINPLVAGGAVALFLGGKNMKEAVNHSAVTPLKLATMRDYQEIGSPDILSYDGVGQDPVPKNLNADGSLVFGLHNRRKG